MLEIGWRRIVIGVGAAAMAAGLAIGGQVPALAARNGPWSPPACAAAPARLDARAAALDDVRRGPWFRLDAAIDARGALIGQTLVVGVRSQGAPRTLALPPESFAAGPYGHWALVGADDGRSSRLLAIDIEAGCVATLATEADVIRRATVTPDGTAVLEARVSRSERADLGVWRRDVQRPSVATSLLGAIGDDVRFGRTFSTEFAWSTEGDAVAVQSCGATACRTRVLTPDGRAVATTSDPADGPMIGLTGDRLVDLGACRGLPCPIRATDIATGTTTDLALDAGAAVLTGPPDDPSVVAETAGSDPATLVSIDLHTGTRRSLGATGRGGAHLVWGRGAQLAGVVPPPGWLLLAPDGIAPAPADPTARAAVLRRVADGRDLPLDEVTR